MPHPLRVAAGEVVVDRDEVHAAPGQRVEVQRQRGDEGLAFAGRHLGDPALVQHDAADELHVVRHHVPDEVVPDHHDRGAQQPAAGFANGGEGLGEKLVEARGQLLLVLVLQLVEPALQPIPLDRIGAAMLGLAHLLQLGLEGAGALREPLPETQRFAP